MLLQFDATVRNAMLDAIETQIGASPTMKGRTGTAPANCAAADTGTVVVTVALLADWMAAASGGTKAKLGTWQDLSADAAGQLGHVRFYDSGGVCRMQGDVTITGGGGLIEVDNPTLTAGQPFMITAFSLTAANA